MLRSKTRKLLSAAIFMIITVVLAQISKPLPMTPVPFSAILVAVFLAGALLDRKTAMLSLSVYVIFGLLGAPVFPQSGGGLHALAGPTGGFLLSYPLVAVLIACMAEKWGRGFPKYVLYMAFSLIASGNAVFVISFYHVYACRGNRRGIRPYLSAETDVHHKYKVGFGMSAVSFRVKKCKRVDNQPL